MAINNVVLNTVDKIERRYNGDNDCIPGAPIVLWADYELAWALRALAKDVENLSIRLERLGRAVTILAEETTTLEALAVKIVNDNKGGENENNK
jgi:hypothetical protein